MIALCIFAFVASFVLCEPQIKKKYIGISVIYIIVFIFISSLPFYDFQRTGVHHSVFYLVMFVLVSRIFMYIGLYLSQDMDTVSVRDSKNKTLLKKISISSLYSELVFL